MGNHCNSSERRCHDAVYYQGYENATVESEGSGFKCWLYHTLGMRLWVKVTISLSLTGKMEINDLFLRIIVRIKWDTLCHVPNTEPGISQSLNKYKLLIFIYPLNLTKREASIWPQLIFIVLSKTASLPYSLVLLLSTLWLKKTIRIVTKFLQHLFTLNSTHVSNFS